MITQEQIKEFTDQIIHKFAPEKIILFGSHAYGTPHAGSDVDLLIEMPVEGDPMDKTVEIIRTLHPKLDVDILVREPGYVERRAKMGDYLMKEIQEKGKLIYARSN